MKEITFEKHHMPGNMRVNWCLPGSSIVLWRVEMGHSKGQMLCKWKDSTKNICVRGQSKSISGEAMKREI